MSPRAGTFLKEQKIKSSFSERFNPWVWCPAEEPQVIKSSFVVQQNDPSWNNPGVLQEVIPSLDTGSGLLFSDQSRGVALLELLPTAWLSPLVSHSLLRVRIVTVCPALA